MDESSTNKQDRSSFLNNSTPAFDTNSVLKQVMGTETDMKLQHLVGQALQQKEAMIKVLEEQLNAERQRREDITSKFRQQLTEFEQERDAVEKLRKASNYLEKKQNDGRSLASLHHSNTHNSELDLVPSKETQRSSKKGTSSKASLNLTYNPNRVKSSIPKINPIVVPSAKMLK
jgi:hypothetical protein